MAGPVLAPGGGIARPPRLPDYRPGTGTGGTTAGGFSSAEATRTPSGGIGGVYPGAPTISTTAPGDFERQQAERQVAPSNPNDPLAVQIQNQLQGLLNKPVYGPSPTETRFQDAQKRVEELRGLADAAGQADATGNFSLLRNKLIAMGIPVNAPGLSDHDAVLRNTEQTLAQLPMLQKKMSEAGMNVLGEKMASAEMREAEIKQGMGTTGDLLAQLIDEKLKEKVGDIDLKAQGLRSDIGASLAARGLGQSSFAGQRIAQTHLAEQADKAAARGGAYDANQRIKGTIDDTVRQIETRRRELSNKKTLAEAQAASDVAFDFDANAVNQKFQQEIAQLELDAAGSGFLSSLAKGIFSGAAAFFISGGNPVAAGLGFSAGSK